MWLIAESTGWKLEEILDMPLAQLNQIEHAILTSKGVRCRSLNLDKEIREELARLRDSI